MWATPSLFRGRLFVPSLELDFAELLDNEERELLEDFTLLDDFAELELDCTALELLDATLELDFGALLELDFAALELDGMALELDLASLEEEAGVTV